MSEKKLTPQIISELAKEVRTYLMGDTGLGPEDPQKQDSFRPTRITQIAGRRRAFLAGRQNGFARDALKLLWLNPGKNVKELVFRSQEACDTIRERAGQISQAAALDDHSAEAYMEAARQGCDRLHTGVREAMAEREGRPISEILDRVQSITMDVKRWHGFSEDDPDIRRRP
jgi:hypothetical protein